MIEDIIITEQISIPPKLLNANLMNTIETFLSNKVINKCDDENGYIMDLINIISINGGEIVGDNASIIYNVTAKVKSFKVDKDEIIQAIVYKLDNKDLFAQAGPFRIYVSATKISPRYKYESNGNKFVSSSDTISLNSMIPIKVIGKKLTGINKMIVGTIL